MKNKFLIIALLLPIASFAQIEVNGTTVKLTGIDGPILKKSNDTLTVWFTPGEYFWSIRIVNNLKTPFTVDWDKSSFIYNGESSKIMFDDALVINKANPVPPEVVPSMAWLAKKIIPANNVTADYVMPAISKRFVKKRFEETGKPDQAKIILAILIDGRSIVFDYNFVITPKPKK